MANVFGDAVMATVILDLLYSRKADVWVVDVEMRPVVYPVEHGPAGMMVRTAD